MTNSNAHRPKAYNTFRNKILLAFIICSIVPLAFVGKFSYERSLAIAKESIHRSVMYTSKQIGQLISARMNQMEQVADATQYLLYQLTTTSDNPFTGFLNKYNEIRSNISSLVSTSHLYSVNVFVNGEGILTQDGLMFSPIRNLEKYGFSEAGLLALINGSQRNWAVLTDVPILRVPIQPGKRETLISCYWGKYDIDRESLEYVYFVNLQVSEIAKLLEGNLENGISRFFVTDTGMIVAGSGKENIPFDFSMARVSESADFEYLQNSISNGYSFEYPIPENNWRLITVVDHTYIQNKTKGLVKIYFLTIFLILLGLAVAIAILSSSLTKKVSRLANAMRTYKISKENTELLGISKFVNMPAEKRDELDDITVDFIEMANRLEANYQELLNAKIEEEKLKYQLLHAKIKPHFLYNILDSIKTCQLLGDVQTANLMITKLGRFYRKQLSNSAELVLLSSELESVSEYLDIENHCRSGRIRLSVEMEDDLDVLMIPPFTLQPIVENSVQHGLKGSGIDLNIKIKVIYEEDCVHIVVSDDGIGISQDELDMILRGLTERITIDSSHFGLKLLNAKLAIFNGEPYSQNVSIESRTGHGTTVTVRIEPVFFEEENE